MMRVGAVAALCLAAAIALATLRNAGQANVLFAHSGAADHVGEHHRGARHFVHPGAVDHVGRDPSKGRLLWNPEQGFTGKDSHLRSFHAHAFAKRGGAAASDARLESLSQTKFYLDPKMHQEAAKYRELTKCMQLAKIFKGTSPSQRKVTKSQRQEAKSCMKLVGKKNKKGARAAAKSAVEHSGDYLFREVKVPRTKTQLRQGEGAPKARITHKMPAWVQSQAWDDKRQDAIEAKKMKTGQVQHDAAKWEASFPDVHVRPPSKGRSVQESTGTTTHYFFK